MNKVLDPEIRALLQEVARDPRAQLLRVDDLHLPVREEAPVGPAAARLTAAERELVEVHRHEVAQLLFEASRRALYGLPTASANLHHSETLDPQMDQGYPSVWSRRAHQAIQMCPTGHSMVSAVENLEELLNSPRGPIQDARHLALASLRLVSRTETRLCLASTLLEDSQHLF